MKSKDTLVSRRIVRDPKPVGFCLRSVASLGFGLGVFCVSALGQLELPPPRPIEPGAWPTADGTPRVPSSLELTTQLELGRSAPNNSEQAPSTGQSIPQGVAVGNQTGNAAYSFSSRDLDIRDALALFARTYDLNIVPDPEVTGSVTVDFRNLSLAMSMEAILDAHGYYAVENRGLIRVRRTKTEAFTVDYIRLVRSGNGSSTANISSGSGGGGGSSGGGGGSAEVANVSINQTDDIRFWDELSEQLKPLLTAEGQLAINRMAGQIMVTDRKQNVERVGEYLKGVKKTLHRQVDIEARIYEVVLNDQFQLGIDWENVTASVADYYLSTGGGMTGIPVSGTIIKNPFGGASPGSPSLSLAITHEDSKVVVNALSQQGEIEVVSQPRVRTLNNQAALIKVGQDKPFFRQTSTVIAGTGTPTTTSSTEIQIVTIGTILSLTPQIAEDGWVTLDVSPVITRLVGTAQGPDGSTAPEVDVKQTSTLVRMKNGTTVILGGLIQNERTKTVRKVPFLGDIPLVGHVFRGKFTTDRKTELVIFITPTIVH